MADITKMKCPACGATLNVKDYAVGGKCPYCDSEVKITPKGVAEGMSHVIGALGDQLEKSQERINANRKEKMEEQRKKMELAQKNSFKGVLMMCGYLVFMIAILYICKLLGLIG